MTHILDEAFRGKVGAMMPIDEGDMPWKLRLTDVLGFGQPGSDSPGAQSLGQHSCDLVTCDDLHSEGRLRMPKNALLGCFHDAPSWLVRKVSQDEAVRQWFFALVSTTSIASLLWLAEQHTLSQSRRALALSPAR